MKRLVIVVMCIAFAGLTLSQEAPHFASRELVRVKCQNEADFFIGVLETTLDQKTLDIVEAALFPPATEEEAKEAKRRAIDLLIQKGIPSDDAALVTLKADVAVVAVEPIKEVVK